MKKNDFIEVMINDIAFPNKGKGIVEDMPITVKNTIPGQKVMARITKKKNGNLEGELREILECSPLETEKGCSHFELCGGCSYQRISYKEENKIKENIHDVESMSWCRGNVGLALGLLKIQNIIAADRENDMIQEMVDEIHTKICNSNKMKNDCICHGNLSVAEYFIFRYQIFKDEKDLKIATKIVNMVKDRQTFRSLPEIPGFGIFTGEGGLAYELLRLEKCEEVPTLLC